MRKGYALHRVRNTMPRAKGERLTARARD